MTKNGKVNIDKNGRGKSLVPSPHTKHATYEITAN